MPNSAKIAGSNFERQVVDQAKAAGLEARRQPGSGVYKGFPNDVVVDDVLLECKIRAPLTDSNSEKSFRFEWGWMKGVMENALRSGYRFGAVVFRMKGDTRKYVVIQYETLLSLLHE